MKTQLFIIFLLYNHFLKATRRTSLFPRKMVFFIFILLYLFLGIIIFFILRNKGLVEILVINIAGLAISIWILIKKFNNQKNEYEKN